MIFILEYLNFHPKTARKSQNFQKTYATRVVQRTFQIPKNRTITFKFSQKHTHGVWFTNRTMYVPQACGQL